MSSTSETSVNIHALTKCRKWVSAGSVGRTGSCVEKGNRWAKRPPSWILAGDRYQAVVRREVGAYVENGWVEPNRCATQSSQGAGTHSVILYICAPLHHWPKTRSQKLHRPDHKMTVAAPTGSSSILEADTEQWFQGPFWAIGWVPGQPGYTDLISNKQTKRTKQKCWGLCACWQVCGCAILGRREEWERQLAHQFLQNIQKALAIALLFLGTVRWETACPTCVRSRV